MSSSSTSVIVPSEYRPSLADFELLKLIGRGYSGLVYLALEKLSKEPVAIKIVKKGQGNDSRTLLEQEIQRSLSDSSFTLPLLASWHDVNNFYLVSPFCGGHDMEINLAMEGQFHEDRARLYATELLVALEEMKAKKVLHRDIKPANIVFTTRGHIRLIDLGFATKLKASPVTDLDFDVDPNACSGSFKIHDPDFTSAERVGTPSYMSPDQHLGRPYSFEADLHSLGVTIYQMLTGRLPFGEGAKTRDEIFEAVLCEHLVFRPEDKVSPDARDLLAKLLERDSKRPAQLEDIIQHPWFAGVRWDRVRMQATSTSWKPHLSPLPKNTTMFVVNEGSPCVPDLHANFFYVSPQLNALRARGDGSIFNRLSKFFSRDQTLPPATPPSTSSLTPSASPTPLCIEVSPPLSPPVPSTAVTSTSPSEVSTNPNPPLSPPPDMPLPPLPPLPTTVATSSKPSSSTRPPLVPSPARGELPPLHIRQQLAKRAPALPKARPIRGDMTLMPQVLITPADDDVEETPTGVPPALRLPLGDITNQRLLSPSDAERPAFNPVLKPGPRIKLSAPPKRAKRTKRAQKENAPPPPLLSSTHRTPPTAVFMLPPKAVPLPLVIPSTPLQTPRKTPMKPKNATQLPSKTSSPKSATPKTKPAFKVPVKVAESKLDTPRSLVRRRNSESVAKTSVSPVTTRPVPADLANHQEAVYPRPLVREETLSHPALAFADMKEKPAGYPRPPEGATGSKQLVPVKPLSVEEAFAPPPPSPPRPKGTPKSVSPAPTYTSAPQACGVLSITSVAFSKETLAGFYGLSSPRINLDPQDLKQRTGEIIERARSSVVKDMQDSPYLSARAASPPITVGPHYAGYLPGPSATGIINDLRRLWIRLSMAVSRALSWLRYRGEPDFNQF